MQSGIEGGTYKNRNRNARGLARKRKMSKMVSLHSSHTAPRRQVAMGKKKARTAAAAPAGNSVGTSFAATVAGMASLDFTATFAAARNHHRETYEPHHTATDDSVASHSVALRLPLSGIKELRLRGAHAG